jgi:hypothetical protein
MLLMKNWFEWNGGEGVEGKALDSLPVDSMTQLPIEPYGYSSEEGMHNDQVYPWPRA